MGRRTKRTGAVITALAVSALAAPRTGAYFAMHICGRECRRRIAADCGPPHHREYRHCKRGLIASCRRLGPAAACAPPVTTTTLPGPGGSGHVKTVFVILMENQDWASIARNPSAPYCIAHVRPYAELEADLNAGTVARYNFITPNVCDDMHSSCAPLNDRVKQGDMWLSTEVPKILASQAYADDGALFITWDEAETGDGPIGMIVLSPLGKGGGYSNSIHYTHSSTLRTVEEIFGVSPLLGDAAQATDLADLFVAFP